MTLFSNFLDISLLNAYVVFCEKHKNEKLPSRKQLYLDLGECILSHNEEKEPICVPANPEKPKNKRCQNCPKGKRPRHVSADCSKCNRTVCPDHFVKTIVCNECLSLKSRPNWLLPKIRRMVFGRKDKRTVLRLLKLFEEYGRRLTRDDLKPRW